MLLKLKEYSGVVLFYLLLLIVLVCLFYRNKLAEQSFNTYSNTQILVTN